MNHIHLCDTALQGTFPPESSLDDLAIASFCWCTVSYQEVDSFNHQWNKEKTTLIAILFVSHWHNNKMIESFKKSFV